MNKDTVKPREDLLANREESLGKRCPCVCVGGCVCVCVCVCVNMYIKDLQSTNAIT